MAVEPGEFDAHDFDRPEFDMPEAHRDWFISQGWTPRVETPGQPTYAAHFTKRSPSGIHHSLYWDGNRAYDRNEPVYQLESTVPVKGNKGYRSVQSDPNMVFETSDPEEIAKKVKQNEHAWMTGEHNKMLNPGLLKFMQPNNDEWDQRHWVEPVAETPSRATEFGKFVEPKENLHPIWRGGPDGRSGLHRLNSVEHGDLAEELRINGGEVNDDGTVTVYHHTSPELADSIHNSGKMYGKENGVFFTTRGDLGSQGAGRGGAVVKLRVPLSELQLDDAFGDEAHVKIPTKRAGDQVDVSSWLSREAAVSPVKSYLPWADLQGLTPQQSAFQRTHPVVRRQILERARQGNYQQWKALAGVHQAQSAVDFLRASQGRPSPYVHPSRPQPWHNPLDKTVQFSRTGLAVHSAIPKTPVGEGDWVWEEAPPGKGSPQDHPLAPGPYAPDPAKKTAVEGPTGLNDDGEQIPEWHSIGQMQNARGKKYDVRYGRSDMGNWYGQAVDPDIDHTGHDKANDHEAVIKWNPYDGEIAWRGAKSTHKGAYLSMFLKHHLMDHLPDHVEKPQHSTNLTAAGRASLESFYHEHGDPYGDVARALGSDYDEDGNYDGENADENENENENENEPSHDQRLRLEDHGFKEDGVGDWEKDFNHPVTGERIESHTISPDGRLTVRTRGLDGRMIENRDAGTGYHGDHDEAIEQSRQGFAERNLPDMGWTPHYKDPAFDGAGVSQPPSDTPNRWTRHAQPYKWTKTTASSHDAPYHSTITMPVHNAEMPGGPAFRLQTSREGKQDNLYDEGGDLSGDLLNQETRWTKGIHAGGRRDLRLTHPEFHAAVQEHFGRPAQLARGVSPNGTPMESTPDDHSGRFGVVDGGWITAAHPGHHDPSQAVTPVIGYNWDTGQYEGRTPWGQHAMPGRQMTLPMHTAAAAGLTVQDYAGRDGNNDHITRNESGMIPLDWVRTMPGMRGERPGEHRNADEGPEWDDFKSNVAAGTKGYSDPIFIMVEHGKEPRIAEGNHRRDAHVELGSTHIPAQIRYFGHAERQGTVGERTGMPKTAAAIPDETGLKAAGIAVIAMDTGRVLMQQRALNPLMCPCGMGVTWDEMNGYQHDDGSVSHDDSDMSVSEMLDQGHPEVDDDGENDSDETGFDKTAALEFDPNEGTWEFPGGKLDPGESPRAAAVREFREEVGQDLPPGVFVGAWVSPGGITVSAAFGSDDVPEDSRATPSWREVGEANRDDAEGPLESWEQNNPGKVIDNKRLMALPYGYVPWLHHPKDGEEWPEESGRYPTEADIQSGVVQPMVGIKGTGDRADITATPDSARWPGRPWGPGDTQMINHVTGKPTHEMMFDDRVDEHGHPVRHEAAVGDWQNPDGWDRWGEDAHHWWQPVSGGEWPEDSARNPSRQDVKTDVTQPMYTIKNDGVPDGADEDSWMNSDAMEKDWMRGDAEHPLHHLASDGPFYHGTVYPHVVGDEIDPQNSRNYFSDEFGESGPSQPAKRVFFTKDQSAAARYGEEPGGLFRVEPTGSYFEHPWERGTLVSAHPLKIVEQVEPKLGKVAAKAPVYKGFIYLIQSEKDIDLTAREHANPDDPDGDMTEQSAWWDIEHAKKNPALRKECKVGTPWAELELWADKSVRTNKEIKESLAKLGMGLDKHDLANSAFQEHGPDSAYVRFGDWPANERSMNHVTGYPEQGVSVYELNKQGNPMDPDSAMNRGYSDWDDNGNPIGEQDDPEFGDDTADMLRGHLGDACRGHNLEPRRRAHLVKGDLVGFGHDDEPLLENVRSVGHWPCDVHKFIPGLEKTRDGGFSHEGVWKDGKVSWCEHPDHDEDMQHEATVSDPFEKARAGDESQLPTTEDRVRRGDPATGENWWEYETSKKQAKTDGKCSYCKQLATKEIKHSEGMGLIATCDKHFAKGKEAAENCTPDGTRDPSNVDSIREASVQKEAVAWIDRAPRACGCVVKQMKLMDQQQPVQGWMVDHRPHGGRVRWKVTNNGLAQEQGKSRGTAMAERDMLDAYGRVTSNTKEASADIRPKLPEGLRYQDAAENPYQKVDDEDFWRYRDPQYMPSFNESEIARGYQLGDNESHRRSVDVQPMAILKPQTDYPDTDHFDRAMSGSKTDVRWGDPICENCYLRYGHTVPTGAHQWALKKQYDDLGEEKHEFKSMMPDTDSSGNFRESSFKRKSTQPPSRAVFSAIQELVAAGRPELSMRTDDDVTYNQHNRILANDKPQYHVVDVGQNEPQIYAMKSGYNHTFLVPVRHNQTGQTGWLRGSSHIDPSQWKVYPEDQLDTAISGAKTVARIPQSADERYKRQRATGKPAAKEGDVPTDRSGHQLTGPRRDLSDSWEQLARARGGFAD